MTSTNERFGSRRVLSPYGTLGLLLWSVCIASCTREEPKPPAPVAPLAQRVDAVLASWTLYERTVLDDQPVGYWRLGEQPGTAEAQDSSGNGHHGTYRARTPPSWPPQLGMAGAIAGDSDTAARFFWYNNPNVTPITQWNWVEIPFNANNANLIQPQGAFTLEA